MFRTLVIAALALPLSACVSVHSYVDPAYKRAELSELTKPAAPTQIALDVEFQRNGKVKKGGAKSLRPLVVAELTASGVFVVAQPQQTPGGPLRVVANNIAELKDAAGQGFLTGLSSAGRARLLRTSTSSRTGSSAMTRSVTASTSTRSTPRSGTQHHRLG